MRVLKMQTPKPTIIAGCLLFVSFFILSIFALLDKSNADTQNMPFLVSRERDLSTEGSVVAIAWSPDGQALVTASNFGGTLTVWNRGGDRISQFERVGGGPALGGAIAFLAGSSELAFLPEEGADNDAGLSIWDIQTKKIVRTIGGAQPGRDYPLNRMPIFAVPPNQSFLVGATSIGSSSIPGVTANVIIFDTSTWAIRSKVMIPAGVSSISLFKGGQSIAVGALSHGKAQILDSESGAISREINAFDDSKYGLFSINAISGSPDGKYLLVGLGLVVLTGEYDGTPEQNEWLHSVKSSSVRIYDLDTGNQYTDFVPGVAPIRQSAWDPKGRFVAFLDSSAALYLVDPRAPKSYQKIKLPSTSLSLSFSPDGGYLAVATDSGARLFSIH